MVPYGLQQLLAALLPGFPAQGMAYTPTRIPPTVEYQMTYNIKEVTVLLTVVVIVIVIVIVSKSDNDNNN